MQRCLAYACAPDTRPGQEQRATFQGCTGVHVLRDRKVQKEEVSAVSEPDRCDRTNPYVMGDQPPGVTAVAALARSLRLEAGLSTRQLAVRSGLARSTITRLEAGQLRPRRSMLAVLAIGLDSGRPRELLGQLAGAAGADMAVDTPGWRRYRRRRVGRALRSGALPVPAEVARRIRMHQAADQALGQVAMLQKQPGFLGNLEVAEMADKLIRQAEKIRAEAGLRVTVASLKRHLTEGMMDDGGPTPTT